MPAYLRETPDGCTIAIRVQPGAKRTAIVGVYGEGQSAQLKIALQAAPIDGRANDALIQYLSDLLSVTRTSVTILNGHSSRSKVCAIKASPAKSVRDRLTHSFAPESLD